MRHDCQTPAKLWLASSVSPSLVSLSQFLFLHLAFHWLIEGSLPSSLRGTISCSAQLRLNRCGPFSDCFRGAGGYKLAVQSLGPYAWWRSWAVQWRLRRQPCEWSECRVHQRGCWKQFVPANHRAWEIQLLQQNLCYTHETFMVQASIVAPHNHLHER